MARILVAEDDKPLAQLLTANLEQDGHEVVVAEDGRYVLDTLMEQTFDVVWCQNVTMNIADKAGFLAVVYRVLKRGGTVHSDRIFTRARWRHYFPGTVGL